jgi:hypothetical protein
MKRTVPMLALAAVLLTAPAFAKDHDKEMCDKTGKHSGMMWDKMLERADTNKDGKISKDEFLAEEAKHFDEMDTNKDGVVTADESKAFHEAMREKMKAHMEEMKKGGMDKMHDMKQHGMDKLDQSIDKMVPPAVKN